MARTWGFPSQSPMVLLGVRSVVTGSRPQARHSLPSWMDGCNHIQRPFVLFLVRADAVRYIALERSQNEGHPTRLPHMITWNLSARSRSRALGCMRAVPPVYFTLPHTTRPPPHSRLPLHPVRRVGSRPAQCAVRLPARLLSIL